jgi:HD-like signal output (HDOD) protein
MQPALERLFSHIDDIPRVPEVVKTLLDQVNDPDIDFKAVASNIEKEQVLAIKVLRNVNSAHLGLRKRVSSIQDALTILGMQEIRKLVIVTGLAETLPHLPNIDLNDFWQDSYRTATYAKWIAEQAQLGHSEMIFTAGLIYDLGMILIHLGEPDAASDITEAVYQGQDRLDSERQYLGFTSHEACAELCRQWQFPEELISTVEKSGEPLTYSQLSLSACAVHVARYVSQSSYSDEGEDVLLQTFPVQEWQKLGLDKNSILSSMATMSKLETGLDGLLD